MKAILVLDEMPECCEKCPVFYRIPGDFGCGVSSHHMMDWVDRPDWCPLRTLPEKRYFDKSRIITSDDYATEDVIEHFEAFGWNEFRAQLLGEEKK